MAKDYHIPCDFCIYNPKVDTDICGDCPAEGVYEDFCADCLVPNSENNSEKGDNVG